MATSLTILHPQSKKYLIFSAEIIRFTDLLLEETKKTNFSLSIVLVSDKEIREFNKNFRHKDQATNVLSFPFLDGVEPFLCNLPTQELGDIIISLDTAYREAKEYEVDFSKRLGWLIIHGLLHLYGLDHERSQSEAEEMEAREQELLTLLRFQLSELA